MVGAAITGRQWIYPKIIKGKLHSYRNMVGWVLLAMLFAGPFVRLFGEQLILFNILEAKFVFFGVVFWPQDFYLFVLGMLIFLVFIVLFTAVFGRVWCGWACPQTIFMEMVFRKIEYLIEGDANKQRKLNAAPLSVEKALKKGAKHAIFVLISFLIANTFLAYIISSETLLKIITEPVSQHVWGFVSIAVFTLLFYAVFAFVREIVCTMICPYGRLQNVLLDNKSMIVGYDYQRGEPRQKINKRIETVHGDCVDCDLCVQVCPTGIDIRKGTQLECINCTMCIDACDMVMEKTHRPTRLIGFKSEDEIKTGKPFKLSKRVYAYTAVLFAMMSVLAFLIIRRTDVETTLLRAGGTLYQMRDDGTVSNLYIAEIINKTNHTIKFNIKPADAFATVQYIQQVDSINKGSSMKLTFFIIRPQKGISKYKSSMKLNVVSEERIIEDIETTFIAPPNL